MNALWESLGPIHRQLSGVRCEYKWVNQVHLLPHIQEKYGSTTVRFKSKPRLKKLRAPLSLAQRSSSAAASGRINGSIAAQRSRPSVLEHFSASHRLYVLVSALSASAFSVVYRMKNVGKLPEP